MQATMYDPAREAINLGVRATEHRYNSLHRSCDEIDALNKKITTIMEVSRELSALPSGKDSYTLSNRSIAILNETGIRSNGDPKLAANDLFELRSQVQSELTQLRDKVEQVFGTKISPCTHEISMLDKATLATLGDDRDLKRYIIQNSGGRG